ncbi:hypothetical protein [Streptomyces sp. NBC_00842]|uniref:hypothetical protein n=1 Tax=Streptomyces sp. NBC_00842 TaxID=2975848 RepID=UPI002F90AC2A|nr:hypothetical protein OH821_45270 [Streptomyces sp. NBC_00842]
MGIVVFLFLAPSFAALAVGIWRARPRELPDRYVAHRPHLHPAVVQAELEVRQAYRDLELLYDTPTLSGPPTR